MTSLLLYDPICIPGNKEDFIFLHPAQIVCVQSAGKYCDIHLVDGKAEKSVSLSITEMAGLLPENIFYRVHRSYIVSKLHIKSMNRQKTRIYCLNDLYVQIGGNFQDDFLRKIGM